MSEITELSRGIADYFRRERDADRTKGASVIPPNLQSDKPEERDAAAVDYGTRLLDKPASQLTPSEIAWIENEIRKCLREGE